MTEVRWDEALDEFEAALDAQERAVETGEVDDFPAFMPPRLAAPLPVELAERAQALLDRSRAVEQRLATWLVDTGRQLKVAERFADDRREASVPHFVDRGL